MKKIKSLNGFTIYETTKRDEKDGYTIGEYVLYFSSDIKDFGREYSDVEYTASNLAEAEELANGTKYAIAKEELEQETTAVSHEDIEKKAEELERAEENTKHCEAIAEELKRIYNGEYFNYNGEALPYDINAEYWKNNYWGYTAGLTDDGEEIYLLDGEALAPEDLEPYTMWDYFGDCLDIDYILDSNREFKACRIMVACGGPNIYINTWENKIELYWWTERAEAWLPSEVCQEINAVFGELFYC